MIGASTIGSIALYIVGVVGAVLIEEALRRFAWPHIRDWWRRRWFKKAAPMIVEKQAAYMAHHRDAMDTFWRAQGAQTDEVCRRIREHILEPIAGTLTTGPGEQIKVVWYRPDDTGTQLVMYQQVGHTPEGQASMRIPIGGGIAGRAFATGELVQTPDCRGDGRFHEVDKSKADGALVCAPIKRADQVTGVLSVMSNWKYVFWLPEWLYFEGLASAIAAVETLEDPVPRTDNTT